MLPAASSSRPIVPAALAAPGAGRGLIWLRQPANALFLPTMCLAGLLLVLDLGRNPIQFWDESRLAVNAAEMEQSGNWLVTQFQGSPDLWNTKPPLLIWLQALSLKMLGYSEWAIRLPTMLATLGTVALLYWFLARVLRQPLGGLAAALVLVTSSGYLRLHVARTGDYDALLVFWQVLLWVAFYRCIENRQPRQLFWVALALTAAVFTKSAAGLLGVPALVLYALLRGRLGWLLRQPLLYALALPSLGSIVGFMLLREQASPGYWEAVLFNDLSGRFLGTEPSNPAVPNSIAQHIHPWDTYLNQITQSNFLPWIYLLLPAGWFIWRSQQAEIRRAGLLAALFAGTWLTVISISAAKLEWYDAPLYPALALLVGLGLALGLQTLVGYFAPRPSRVRQLLPALLLLLVCAFPYQATLTRLLDERHNAENLPSPVRLNAYVSQLLRANPWYRRIVPLYAGGYKAPLIWYQHAYKERDIALSACSVSVLRTLPFETVVVLSDPTYRARLDSAFQTRVLHDDEFGQSLLLLPRRLQSQDSPRSGP